MKNELIAAMQEAVKTLKEYPAKRLEIP